MNYKRVYISIIKNAIKETENGLRPRTNKDRLKYKDIYFEFHHILPKSLFPLWEDRLSNKVALTAREHYFCHELLTKIYPGMEMAYAFMRLANDSRNRGATMREYERAKKEFGSYMSVYQKNLYNNLSEAEKKIRIQKHTESMLNRTPEEKFATKQKELQTKANRTEEQILLTREKRRKTWSEKSEEVIEGYKDKWRKSYKENFTKKEPEREYKRLQKEIKHKEKLLTHEQKSEIAKKTAKKHEGDLDFKKSVAKKKRATYFSKSEEERNIISEKRKRTIAMKSKEEKDAIYRKVSETLRNGIHNEERKKRISETLKNKTNEEKRASRDKAKETRSRWSEEKRRELHDIRCKRQSTYKWWNNGIVSTMSSECPGSDWVRGRILSAKK